MKPIIAFFITAAGFFYFHSSPAQVDNTSFYDTYQLQRYDSNSLQLNLYALGFTKNQEYFNDIADGYTLFGYQLSPVIKYQPLANFAVEAGAFLRKDFGDNGFRNAQPIFRLIYQRDSMQLIFGSIEGGLNHGLIEPLYDFDRFLQDPVENGFQARVFRDTWQADLWVEWQNMIYEGDPEQEEVTGGLVIEKQILPNLPVKVYLPLQLLVYHRGGQIDINPDPLVTLFNSAAGVKLEYSSKGLFRRWQFSGYYLYAHDYSNIRELPFKDGDALYFNLSATTHFNLQTMLSYWKGTEFFSITGGQLYPSVSSVFKRPGLTELERQLLILRFTHQLPVYKGIYITGRFEPYYDLNNKTFEFSHGLYVSYRHPIMLMKKVVK